MDEVGDDAALRDVLGELFEYLLGGEVVLAQQQVRLLGGEEPVTDLLILNDNRIRNRELRDIRLEAGILLQPEQVVDLLDDRVARDEGHCFEFLLYGERGTRSMRIVQSLILPPSFRFFFNSYLLGRVSAFLQF